MKGLFKTIVILVAIITVGVGASVLITTYLDSRLSTAHERGLEEGYTQGYEAGLLEGQKVGYQEGSKTGLAWTNRADNSDNGSSGFYFLYNPTYAEMREALAEIGRHSAEEIHDYAEASGIRVAYVRCPIARKAAEGMVYAYHLVAFETVDRGQVIIEPLTHRKVKVEVGKGFRELNGFPIPDFDDTITEITIVW